jgi:sec-independent protein translocase protein TatC
MFKFLARSIQKKAEDLTFWDHIDVFRVYVIRSIFFIFLFSIIAFSYKSFVFDSIILAPSEPSFITYKILCKLAVLLNLPDLCITSIPLQLINIELGGQFSYHMLISFVVGIILAFPFITYQFWRFIKPALTEKERHYSKGIVFYISSLFTIGVLFGYYVIAPLTINFLASYQLSSLIINNITISSYISTLSILSLSMGLVFELPVLIFFLTKIGILTPQFLRKKRKYAIIIIFIIAGFITPSTDMFSQIIVSVPLYLLYELSYYISKNSKKINV